MIRFSAILKYFSSSSIYSVFKAKKKSEAAFGVGEETDLVVLSEGKLRHVDLGPLNALYEKEKHQIQGIKNSLTQKDIRWSDGKARARPTR
jgi:hypothetical protein